MRGKMIQAVLIVSSLAIGASAQTATATLKGTVTDSGGGVVSGAGLTLTNLSTGLKKTFTTAEGGQFAFTFVEPGAYSIEAQATGFKIYKQPRLLLEVGQVADLGVILSPG